jgi:hypothetical protein
MPWTFDKVIEVQKAISPNTWSIRYTRINSDTGEQESDFAKYIGPSKPVAQDIAPIITKQLQAKNLVPTHPEATLPDDAPQLPGLTAGQQVTLNNIWNLLKIWLKNLWGRR